MPNDSTLRRRYGITRTQYEDILRAQDGRCYICRRKPRARDPQLAVDHDHVSGLVRGLLCATDNHDLLGVFGDDPARYARAAHYLSDPPAIFALGGPIYVPGSPGAEGVL